MTVSATSPIENAYSPANARDLKGEAQRITEKNSENIGQKISVAVLKESLDAQKAEAGQILDMLV